MSAICGLFHLDGRPVRRELITAQTDALAHRGRNGSGEWIHGSIALGHRASHTTAESRRDSQPIIRDDGRLVLVADARIDNRRELAIALGLRRPDAVTDCEIILGAYDRWGTACAEHLIGDFAFAIWNRATQSVFCARDPMGVKPFYYHHSNRLFAFASEMKALLCVPGVPREADRAAVARYIACIVDDRERTQLRGITRLPAGHTLTVARCGTTRVEYWRADRARDVRFTTDAQYVDAFRETFGEAVRARLRADLPVGATLSGGLDSSSVVCMARQLASTRTLPTFSLVFPTLPAEELKLIDEREYIGRVLERPGLDPHFVRGDLLNPLADLSRVLWHLDEPHVAPNLYLHWALYGAARDAGVRVLLDGFDGDAAISHGFGRLNGLLSSGDWPTFTREARALAGHRGKPMESVLPHFGFPMLAAQARDRRLRPWLRTAHELSRRFPVSRRELATTFGVKPALRGALGRISAAGSDDAVLSMLAADLAPDIARELQEAESSAAAMATAGERAMHIDTISQPLYQQTLEIADKAARAFGIEPRYPFFDRRLIEFCVGLPDEQKFGGGWPRYLFRRAMQGVLPPEVQWRATKGNLAPNFDRRFRAIDRPTVASACESPSLLRPYVEPSALTSVSRRYFAGTGWGSRDGLLLFRTTMLANWLPTLDAARDEVADVGESRSTMRTAATLESEPAACART